MNTAVDVRLGKVTDVNKEKRLVRCKFEDTGITSGWLPVMQHYKAIVYTESAGEHNHQYIHPSPYNLEIKTTMDGSRQIWDEEEKVIGADNQILDSQVPVRQSVEQRIARTGIPPFLLGLSWSSTERMSAQQADLMTSEITALRRTLEPAVERICEMWLRLHGWGGDVTVDWADINLQDFVEEARAKLYLAQAEAIREEERT